MQIFIKTINPNSKTYKENSRNLTFDRKFNMFGDNDTVVLPFHNQWLFGRSALRSAINVLNLSSQIEKKDKSEYFRLGHSMTPFTLCGIDYGNFNTFDKYISAITHILNYVSENTEYIPAGFLTSWFLKDEFKDMTNNFTNGDNNDGVLLIDVVENKYCFINIDEQKAQSYDVRELPYMTPCSGAEYVRAYYGETRQTVNPYYLKDKNNKEKNHFLSETIRINTSLIETISKYEVMSIDEVANMFPKMEFDLVN